jgi:ribosomal protein S18 acetylase RimI-like enzyme
VNPIFIRQAEKGDLVNLEWNGAYSHFRRLYADTYMMVEAGTAVIWIAETNGSGLIGQCFVSLKINRPELADGMVRAYIYGFRVKPEYRNQGVGRRIMHTVEADLIKRGFQQVTLNVGQDNQKARHFYERLGYIMVGADPGYWSYIDDKGRRVDMHEPAWRMSKDLGETRAK